MTGAGEQRGACGPGDGPRESRRDADGGYTTLPVRTCPAALWMQLHGARREGAPRKLPGQHRLRAISMLMSPGRAAQRGAGCAVSAYWTGYSAAAVVTSEQVRSAPPRTWQRRRVRPRSGMAFPIVPMCTLSYSVNSFFCEYSSRASYPYELSFSCCSLAGITIFPGTAARRARV